MYDIKPYTIKKAKELKVKVVPSTNPKKKIDVYQDNKKIASIGDIRYKDYPTYLRDNGKEYADDRRRLYHIRHKNEGIVGKYAKELLW